MKLLLFGLLFISCFCNQSRAQTPSAPNVLFVISDDLRDELGCYGHDHIHSPNIDALASAGTLFHHAYCQYAVCGASRASFFTGRYPDQIGVYGNSIRFRDQHPDLVTLPQHFTNNGLPHQGIRKAVAQPRGRSSFLE